MAYYLYKRTALGDSEFRYNAPSGNQRLFGTSEGWIAWLVEHLLRDNPSANEPFAWHANVQHILNTSPEFENQTLVIDLKPDSPNVSLYEILDIWGYSANGWTPIMLRLRGLYVDAAADRVNRSDFVRSLEDVEEPIYEFLYVNEGTIEHGKVVGRWMPPRPSSTNGALLWPDALNYFIGSIRSCTPEAID